MSSLSTTEAEDTDVVGVPTTATIEPVAFVGVLRLPVIPSTVTADGDTVWARRLRQDGALLTFGLKKPVTSKYNKALYYMKKTYICCGCTYDFY